MKRNLSFYHFLSLAALLFFLAGGGYDLMGQTTIQIGNGTSGTYNIPIGTAYDYSLSEIIYTKEDIAMDDYRQTLTINSISFYYKLETAKTYGLVVYMKNTSKSKFENGNDFVVMTNSDKVFDGNITTPSNAGWVTISLDNPFTYNTDSNLLIAIDKNSGGNTGYSNSFNYTSTTNNTTLYYSSNNTNPDPTTSVSGSSASKYRPNIKITFAENYYLSPGYTNNFDNEASGDMPRFWAKLNNNTYDGTLYDNYPRIYNNGAHSGSNCLYFSGSLYIQTEIAVMPIVNVSNLHGLTLEFWAKLNTSSNKRISISVLNDPADASTWDESKEQTVTILSTTYAKYSVALPNTTTTTIGIKLLDLGGPNIYIDDLVLRNTDDQIFICDDNMSSGTFDNVIIKADVTIPADVNVSASIVNVENDKTLIIADGGSLSVNDLMTVNGTLTNNGSSSSLTMNNGAQLIYSNSVPATIKKTITSADSKDAKDHWYTITTPVHKGSTDNIIISENPSITTNDYDMFYLNEATGIWMNQKAGSNALGFTNMYIGKGYIYRSNNGGFELIGNTTVGNQIVSLSQTTDSPTKGLNLIGNPFSHNIYKGDKGAIDNANLSDYFHYLTNSGVWQLGTHETPITPGMGIIVQANIDELSLTIEDNTNIPDQETVHPAKGTRESSTELQFILNGNQYQDIAYAVLNEGYGLSKLEHPNEAAPMLFINHNDKNYAVAHMNSNTRSFNLGLSAKSFGQYTLKYKAKGNVKYLHVIDRLTGDDVDMLLEGGYSFIASPTDNENRFLVVLESLEALETLDGTFAYQNGNDIIVNGEGNLQIFDVMGRLIATQRVNGVETVNVSTTGVYIFKLNEKTQKIIIR